MGVLSRVGQDHPLAVCQKSSVFVLYVGVSPLSLLFVTLGRSVGLIGGEWKWVAKEKAHKGAPERLWRQLMPKTNCYYLISMYTS